MSEDVFDADADTAVIDIPDISILCLSREKNGERLIAVFNFGDWENEINVPAEGKFTDLLTGMDVDIHAVKLQGHDFKWLKKSK